MNVLIKFSNYKNIRSATDVLCVMLIYPYKKKNALRKKLAIASN